MNNSNRMEQFDEVADMIIGCIQDNPLGTFSPQARQKLKTALKHIDKFEAGVEKCSKCAFVATRADREPCASCCFNDGPYNNFKVPTKRG